jgi:hypothetical protein
MSSRPTAEPMLRTAEAAAFSARPSRAPAAWAGAAEDGVLQAAHQAAAGFGRWVRALPCRWAGAIPRTGAPLGGAFGWRGRLRPHGP